MTSDNRLQGLLEQIELPDRAYQSAKRRYDDLGAWFDREDCTVRHNDPHIFVQGSFALGTAIRPVKEGAEYDLDLSCKLRQDVGRTTHSQRALAEMVRSELEAYRRYRQIQDRLEPKNRCWRLNYQDDLRFHMDVVPAIPVEIDRRSILTTLVEQHGVNRILAERIAADAVWITDRRLPGFDCIQEHWLSSNPEGYVRWFVSRMEGAHVILEKKAQVDAVPLFARKTPLQRAIQLLKHHRDVIFEKAPDRKPISIILTTIAGRAYAPGQSLGDAMATILQAFEIFRQSDSNEVLNPVNPAENFADRWRLQECKHLHLKENFHNWIIQAGRDFRYWMSESDPQELMKHAESRLKIRLDENAVAAFLGAVVPAAAVSIHRPRHVSIHSAPRPWSFGR